MRRFRITKPVMVGKGTLPVGREMLPGDFGIPEEQLEEMVKKEQAEEIKPPRRKKDEDDE